MSTTPEVPIRVTREMIEAHYKSVMNAARLLLSQGETIHAQDLLSEACSRPYPTPAPASTEALIVAEPEPLWVDMRETALRGIRADFWDVLLRAPNEIAGLRAALIDGRIDGSSYAGECACLIGTIANLRHAHAPIDDLGNGLKPDMERPIEQWFTATREGDTPETNMHSALAVQWLDEFDALLAHAMQQSD